jgi:hypothetical protein
MKLYKESKINFLIFMKTMRISINFMTLNVFNFANFNKNNLLILTLLILKMNIKIFNKKKIKTQDKLKLLMQKIFFL